MRRKYGYTPHLLRQAASLSFIKKRRRVMVPLKHICSSCGKSTDIRTYRKFICCPYCGERDPFPGFEYRDIDWNSSMYAHVKHVMDCPACRGKSMFLGPSRRKWHCPDCGHQISALKKPFTVFWFCDDCEAFLNVQPGFNTKEKQWTCMECGCVCDVSRGNII